MAIRDGAIPLSRLPPQADETTERICTEDRKGHKGTPPVVRWESRGISCCSGSVAAFQSWRPLRSFVARFLCDDSLLRPMNLRKDLYRRSQRSQRSRNATGGALEMPEYNPAMANTFCSL